jgi:hypothetical protein
LLSEQLDKITKIDELQHELDQMKLCWRTEYVVILP